jgi:hypothetical protein
MYTPIINEACYKNVDGSSCVGENDLEEYWLAVVLASRYLAI